MCDGAGTCSATPVINEIQTAGSTATDEFIELYNPGSTAYPLASHALVYRSAIGATDVVLLSFTSQTIPAGGYFLAAGTGFTGTGADAVYTSTPLSNLGGGVALRDPSGNILDSVGYGTATNSFVVVAPAPAPPANKSIERLPDGTNSHNNFVDFVLSSASTPKAMNH